MGKKKFIDKKKSATFQLMARDSSDPSYSSEPSGDRVFIRVDNNQYTPPDSNSVFADAPEDDEDEYDASFGMGNYSAQETELPEKLRKEIIELGFPDDGYNYLAHLREIKNTGGGSAYYQNPKATFQQLPRDVKAYDASRIEVPKINIVADEKLISNVASKTVAVKLQKVVDPEVAALLDDSDSAKFGSDDDEDLELEEDFVTKANHFEGTLDEDFGKNLNIVSDSRVGLGNVVSCSSVIAESGTRLPALDTELPRLRRPLDEQFDMLELQEYDTDNEEEYNNNDYMDDEYEHEKPLAEMDDEYEHEKPLAEKLNHAFKNHPSDLLHHDLGANDIESPEAAPEVIKRCKEYGEKYENEDEDEKEVVFVEESSDESEKWDCETIVTTYSTLDNHPGKIGAPENRRSRNLVERVNGVSAAATSGVIALKGKERLPVDFLPCSKKQLEEKTKDEKDWGCKESELPKWKPRSQESKEEKKERKSAVKSERREARQLKKEMRGLYKFESQRAQKVAAFTGPSSIHLM